MSLKRLEATRALWNRNRLDLGSDETLAQILDRGEMQDWRALYRIAQNDRQLRQRLTHVVYTVPLPLPYFWLAALASLGERVDFERELPSFGQAGP